MLSVVLINPRIWDLTQPLVMGLIWVHVQRPIVL